MTRFECLFIAVALLALFVFFLRSKACDRLCNWLSGKKPQTPAELEAALKEADKTKKNLAGAVTQAERSLNRDQAHVSKLKNQLK